MSKNVDSRILNYKENAPLLYLDGRYFNLVLGKSDEVSTKPIIIKIKSSHTKTNLGEIYINVTKPYMLFRIIIEVYEQINVNGRLLDRVYTRHSNLLIIDNIHNIITRFEPLQINVYNNNINTVLQDNFESTLPQHSYVNLDIHPQVP